MKNFFKDKNLIIIFVCVTLLMSGIFTSTIINGDDTIFHMFRIVGMSTDWLNGDLFAKIHYNSISGFGYGAGIFYPQLNMVLPALLYLIIGNISISVKLYIYFNVLLSAVAMYAFLKVISDNKNVSLVGSLLYVFAPYVYVQSMFRGAYGEMTGFVSLPLIFLGIELIFKNNKWGPLFLILGGVYVLQSHIISTVYVSIFSFLYLVLNYKKTIKKENLRKILFSLFVIILLSLYFLIPFIQHYLLGGYNILDKRFDPSSSVVFLVQLLFSMGGHGFSRGGADFSGEMPFTISLLIVGVLLLLPLIYRKIKDDDKKLLMKFLGLGILAIFMTCCPLIWGHIKFLDVIQAPYRLLMFCVFFLAVACAIVLKYLEIKNFNILLVGVIVLSFMQINNYVVSTPYKYNSYFVYDKSVSNYIDLNGFVKGDINVSEDTIKKALGAFNDYLPLNSDDYVINRDKDIISLDGAKLDIANYTNKNGKIYANVETTTVTTVELPLVYYLGYDIQNNGKVIDYEKDKNGFISIVLDKGSNEIKVSYRGTTLDIIGNILSIITFCMFIIYVFNLRYNFIRLKR